MFESQTLVVLNGALPPLIIAVFLFAVVPYCLPLAMPNWQCLLVLFCVVGGFFGWQLFALQQWVNVHGADDDMRMELGILKAIFGSICAGTSARAITFWINRNVRRLQAQFVVELLGLPLLTLVFFSINYIVQSA